MLLPVKSKEGLMTLDQMQKGYKGKGIDEIESMIESAKVGVLKSIEKLISLLFHCEKTNIFRKNDRFKKSSFADYLLFRHDLTYTKYDEYRKAFRFYPKEVGMLGMPAVVKIRKKCDDPGAKKAFAEIRAYAKNHFLEQTKINEIIDKHTIEVKRKLPEIESKTELKLKLNLISTANNELLKENKELSQQIGKLKKTVEEYKKVIDNLQKTIEKYV